MSAGTPLMREIHVEDPQVAEAVIDTLAHDVVMVQMPAVFVLLAPPTALGASWLDRTKTRQPDKNYGTALGALESLHRMAVPGSLPPELDGVEQLAVLTGAFIRLAVAATGVNTVMLRDGTHQGVLLEEGPHRSLFRAVEAALEPTAEPALMGGHRFGAPLCTSANISGHPDGSIVTWDRAYEFGLATKVPLVVRCEPASGEAGSYPIFWLRHDRISIERAGPGMDELRRALPARLFQDS
jgi:tRNA A37 threonylcarbamoyladenosine synthetase subunit TsaC/SUA5/YrdC